MLKRELQQKQQDFVKEVRLTEELGWRSSRVRIPDNGTSYHPTQQQNLLIIDLRKSKQNLQID